MDDAIKCLWKCFIGALGDLSPIFQRRTSTSKIDTIGRLMFKLLGSANGRFTHLHLKIITGQVLFLTAFQSKYFQ